nr:zinc-binding dehydrogenase [Rhodococcus sp. BS-15]
MRVDGFSSGETRWLGSDMDGAFAQFVVVPANEVFPVDCDWTDAELATIPCAYGTAENMIARAGVRRGSTVLITGASGGVGSAAVQLAVRRGARVIGVASRAKHEQLRELGVDEVYGRDADLVDALGTRSSMWWSTTSQPTVSVLCSTSSFVGERTYPRVRSRDPSSRWIYGRCT